MNSFKNRPATSAPPIRSPTFAISATAVSSDGRNSSGSGNCQNCSPVTSVTSKNSAHSSSLFVITAEVRVPSAITFAPVNVATSMIASNFLFS